MPGERTKVGRARKGSFLFGKEVSMGLWNKPNRSYYKWGLMELERRMKEMPKHGYDDYEIVNLFIHEMEQYACMNLKNSHMFSCAADAGRQVLDGFLPYYY